MKFIIVFILGFVVFVTGQQRSSLSKLDMNNRYQNGQVMENIMAAKMKTWNSFRDKGYFEKGRWNSSGSNSFSGCGRKKAGYLSVAGVDYRCKNLDVTGYLSHHELGTTRNLTLGTVTINVSAITAWMLTRILS